MSVKSVHPSNSETDKLGLLLKSTSAEDIKIFKYIAMRDPVFLRTSMPQRGTFILSNFFNMSAKGCERSERDGDKPGHEQDE